MVLAPIQESTSANGTFLKSNYHIAAYSSDLKDDSVLAARILGEDIVLWRSAGRVHAWRDLCIHRGAKLSLGSVKEGRLTCAYHGWTYGEEGKCVSIPAHPGQPPPSKAVVQTYQTEERYGFIWVCLGTPNRSVPEFPEWADKGHRKIYCGPYHINASGPRVVENFLDVAHLPFVHEGLLGDRGHARIDDYDVVLDANGITAKNVKIWQPDPDGTGVGSSVTYTYRVFTPLTCYFVKESTSKGFAIFCGVTPVEASKSIMWMIISMNYADEIPDSQIRQFEDRVVMQDVKIVESQRPELLPLDLQSELHLRSDKTAIAYRKWLNKLNIGFGTL